MSLTSCFVTPALPLAGRPALRNAAAPRRAPRTAPTALLGPFGRGPRFNSGSSPFGSFGRFFSAGGSGGQSAGGSGAGKGSGGAGGSDSDGEKNIFQSIWAGYNSRLDRFPITTKAFTSFVGFLLGDLLAQKFLGEKGSDLDYARLARMAMFGFMVHGPTGHYFYGFLDRLIVGASPLKVASKVAIDQVLWAPIFTAAFFTFLGVAERKSFQDIKKKIQNDTWTGVTTSWKFWPLAHTINFAFIPSAQRLLYINTLQVGYNVILSIIGNK